MPTPFASPAAARPASRDLSLDYLRAFATVLVLVIHTSAPYTRLALETRPVFWGAPVPILDTAHSTVLDYVLRLLDASTMSLMFFISGIFIYPGLRKRGGLEFVRDRAVRLSLPFLAMTLLWMPLAYYAPWGLQHPAGSFGRFLLVDARAGFASGPGWFLWLLLFFDCTLAALYGVAGGLIERLLPRLRALGRRPALWALLLVLAGAVVYVPLAVHYADRWMPLITPPLVLQPSRAIFYAVWLLAGFVAGSAGLNKGLLSPQGPLARRWLAWSVLALSAGNALWLGWTRPWLMATSPLAQALAYRMLWVVADVGICFGLIAIFRACVHTRRRWADSLARNAYAIYALHYVFALWLERWLLPVDWSALAKFSLALAGTLALSWPAAIAWFRLWNWLSDTCSRHVFPYQPAAATARPKTESGGERNALRAKVRWRA